MSEENKQQAVVEPTEAETLAQSRKLFEVRIEAALQHLHMLMGSCSARNIQRALDAALTLPVGLKQSKKFATKKEVELAGLLAQILDLRTVIQGYKMREEQNFNPKGEQSEQ